MTNNILLTVGFCIKNVENTVKSAVDSILEQDFPHDGMEIIVVDGSSADKTLPLVKASLYDSPVSHRIIPESGGLGIARQMVVNCARGKYILWVDGDMVLPRSYMRKQVEFMEINPHVGIAGGKYDVHLGHGLAADLENIAYVVDSVYGEKGASRFGYLPGTEGAIYRTCAIRQIGGFDTRMIGAAEDTEVAYRMRSGGWKLAVTQEVFTESTRPSWLSLWAQYAWYGRGGHFVFHKDRNVITLWKMIPIAGFIAGVLRCPAAYLLTHKLSVFLLPIHYAFKRIAWFFGFFQAHLDDYGHSTMN